MVARPDLPPRAFAALQDQIDAQPGREPVTVRAGHADLGEALWLSCDSAGQAEMACRPAGEGFHLSIEGAESGGWACLGMRLAPETLARGRYLGLLIDATPEALVAFGPALRYYLRGGDMRDEGPPSPVVLPTGPNRQLIHIPIHAALLAEAEGCELNLFFQGDRVALTLHRLEPLLIS